MKTRRFLIVVMFLFTSATSLWEAWSSEDQDGFVDWLKNRAAQGDAKAQSSLGLVYYKGLAVPQDYTEALKWFRLAAAQRDAMAQANLGIMYYDGQGVPQDYTEALKWFRLAAAQRDATAQTNLGFIYTNGQSVPQDYVQAHKWFNLAAANFTAEPDRDKAVKARDALATRMTPAQIAEAQKLAREWKKQ